MSHLETGALVQQIGTLFEGASATGLTDRQLVERFNARRDASGEAAFTTLVARHGPMVLSVCRQLLDDEHLAQDAFQATFLILARKARSLRDADRLGNWLYGVASRTARCARLRLADRRKKEEDGTMIGTSAVVPAEPTVPPAEEAVMAREHARLLHGEIERLPDVFRLPVVLCYLEGLTVHEAARQLAWSHGTVRSRMARAREKLRRGLTRRGVILPAAVLTLVLDSRPAPASVSSPLCDATTRAALHFALKPAAAEGLSATTVTLAQEVLRSMLIHRLKVVAAMFLLLGAVATGAGYLTHSLAMKDEPREKPASQQTRPIGEPVRADQNAAPGRMFVTGVVLDLAGKPVVGAIVDIIGRPRAPWVVTREPMDPRVIVGHGDTGNDGSFRIDAMRTSADGFFEVDAIATAPGFGLGWIRLNADAKQPAAEIQLHPEQVIQGKLFDVKGQPATGVELQVWAIGRPEPTRAVGGYDGVSLGNSTPPEGCRVWPKPSTTDARGQFTITGIGRDLAVRVHVHDDRFASVGLQIRTDSPDGPKKVTQALQPSMLIEGRVLAADTGQPIPQALVEVGLAMSGGGSRFRANPQGRFAAHVQPASRYRIEAIPSEGQPYLISEVEFDWTKGAIRKEVDVKVPRGVVIKGRVIEQGTGRMLSNASVQYIPDQRPARVASGWQTIVSSDKDGTYQIVVPPGTGQLFVFGPTSDYVLEAVGNHRFFTGQRGATRHYAHDIISYDVKAGDQAHKLSFELRPGKTVKGRVVGPDNQVIKDAMIISTLKIEHFHLIWRGDLMLHARDGLFQLHGIDPDKPARVSFLDADHQWGATVEISAGQASEDVTVRLQPCGRVKARLVTATGKPVVKASPQFEILGTPESVEKDDRNHSEFKLAADAVLVVNVDPLYDPNRFFTDTEGRITLPDLIPGALYRISDMSTINNPDKGTQTRKEFSVKPAETLDIGDVLIEDPKWYGQ